MIMLDQRQRKSPKTVHNLVDNIDLTKFGNLSTQSLFNSAANSTNFVMNKKKGWEEINCMWLHQRWITYINIRGIYVIGIRNTVSFVQYYAIIIIWNALLVLIFQFIVFSQRVSTGVCFHFNGGLRCVCKSQMWTPGEYPSIDVINVGSKTEKNETKAMTKLEESKNSHNNRFSGLCKASHQMFSLSISPELCLTTLK